MSPNDTVGGSPPIPAKGLNDLTELAMDLRWSWNHSGDQLWAKLDKEMWERTRHASVVLQSASQDKLARAFADPEFCRMLDGLVKAKRSADTAPAWFQERYPGAPFGCVAYFCMEFMLTEALPIYSGGLGNVAGDQLKAASNLGIPIVGVGLLYQHGYFRQAIDRNGAQQALYPYNDPGQMPVTPLRRPNGDWLRLDVALPGGAVWLRAWEVHVGRVKLYLLDSNDPENAPSHKGITGELYGGDTELRLKQEMVLGIGGWRLLAMLGIKPDVCHLNEGHAAFALLERAKGFMGDTGQPFSAALAATRAGNLFTTHTAVAAGFDLFSPALIEEHLGQYARESLHISLGELMALGRQNPDDLEEPFNMAYLAIRGSGAINGVSELHGRVSRRIFAPLFPRWPEDEVPVRHVTNGVHMPTWDSAAADRLWTESCGRERWLGTSTTLESDFRRVSDEKLWNLRTLSRKALVDYVRERVAQQMSGVGAEPAEIARTQAGLDPEVLTLGFARRFATYKRPNLLLHDPERLLRILRNPKRRAQLVLAGKAHPADRAGQALIQEWTRFIKHNENAPPVVFLSDYDMLMAERLVQGVDVWINTPQRPWEACGTSGMKVLVNGGLNLSELDGWWAEAYAPDIGWALGDGREHGDDPAWNAAEAEALYERLEHEVIPEFYSRDDSGIPRAWLARIRESMARLTPRFAASRAVRDYTELCYTPAAAAYRERAANNGLAGMQLTDWMRTVDRAWPSVRFGDVRVTGDSGQNRFEVEVQPNEMDPKAMRVQLYADAVDGGSPEIVEMESAPASGVSRVRVYRATVAGGRAAGDFTARVVPAHAGASVPLESSRILWQR